MKCIIALSCLLLMSGAGLLRADQAADEAAIRKAVEDYVTAYNAHDAKALASRWSEYAVYENPLTGEEVTGRKAIEEEFKSIFDELKDGKLVVKVTSIEFVSPGVALEQGTAQVLGADSDEEVTEYSAVHVKHDDAWLLDRVTEKEEVEVTSHYEQLKPLEGLIGTWVDEDETARVETTCQWAKNQNFITRSFTIDLAEEPEMSGIQVIGWDGAAGKIRSWVFDTDGGFSEGTWTKDDDSWVVENSAILPDGRRGSSINIIKLLDKDTLSWQITGRDVDGEVLPNLPEVKISRKD